MVNGERDVLLKECLTTIQTDINNTLKPKKNQLKHFGLNQWRLKGCGYHPSIEEMMM